MTRSITKFTSIRGDNVEITKSTCDPTPECAFFMNDHLLFKVDAENEEKMALINNIIHEMLENDWKEERTIEHVV
jgi:hypothetical protein